MTDGTHEIEEKPRGDVSALDDLLCVGDVDKKQVSNLNNELFTKGREIMEDSSGIGESLNHIGWYDFGKFIDYLESNYEIKKKDT